MMNDNFYENGFNDNYSPKIVSVISTFVYNGRVDDDNVKLPMRSNTWFPSISYMLNLESKLFDESFKKKYNEISTTKLFIQKHRQYRGGRSMIDVLDNEVDDIRILILIDSFNFIIHVAVYVSDCNNYGVNSDIIYLLQQKFNIMFYKMLQCAKRIPDLNKKNDKEIIQWLNGTITFSSDDQVTESLKSNWEIFMMHRCNFLIQQTVADQNRMTNEMKKNSIDNSIAYIENSTGELTKVHVYGELRLSEFLSPLLYHPK